MQRCCQLLLVGILALVPSALVAGVYASGVHFTNPDSTAFDGSVTDGTGLRINYVLNDTASTVVIRLQNASTNAVITTINLTNVAAGWNSTVWNGAGAPAAGATYYATVVATRTPRSATSYRLARWINSTATGFAIFSRGVDIIRDQTNRNFGYLYTSNAGLPIGRGFARYTAAGNASPGTGLLNPFLPQTNVNTSGVGWSEQPSAPVHATVDSLGRVYASDFPLGQVWRMDNNTAVPKRVINVFQPKGIAARGSGSNLKIYIASGSLVVRANIGTADTLSSRLDTVASLGGTVRDVIFDDQGFMYVTVRSGTGFEGTIGGTTFRFSITGTLPVSEFDALWSVAWTGFPIGFGHWSGANPTSAADDVIYVSHQKSSGVDLAGIYRITNVTATTPTREHLLQPNDVPGGGGGDCSSRADLTVDPSGNVVWYENGNEEIIHLEPPGASAVSYTTRSAVTFALGSASVELDETKGIPNRFSLKQNYPNPFNPTTNIEFSVPSSGSVSLKVFDMLGREVATLADEALNAGNYKATFDARSLTSGTYFYTLRAGAFSQTRKLMIVK